jgi:hypothetical protein
MTELVRDRRFSELDYENLGEYLADMARRDRREVESRLAVLIAHLRKWEHQPERRSGSWRATIEVQRQELVRLLESGTLRHHAESVLGRVYADGVRQAAAETSLPNGHLPAGMPLHARSIGGIRSVSRVASNRALWP